MVQLKSFSADSCQSWASRWCVSESDGVEDLAFECEERSFWVMTALLLKELVCVEKAPWGRDEKSFSNHVKVGPVLADRLC